MSGECGCEQCRAMREKVLQVGIAEGRRLERAAVLRLLRDAAAQALERAKLAIARGMREDFIAAESALRLTADAIERGDHLPAAPPKETP